MSRQAERKRAIELKAADARTILLSNMPLVYHALTAPQRDQVQRFLDAQVLNPVIEREFKELDRKSIITESNGYTNRNPAIVAQRDKKSEEYIRLGNNDKRIRLDLSKLLARDAFQMQTDNPDEARYHLAVRQTVVSKGVWLRLDRRNPAAGGQPGSFPENDPRRYSFALSVGPDENSSLIPTMNGIISRDALVRTGLFADHYYQRVINGPTRKFLDRAIDRLRIEIAHGWGDHLQYVGADGKAENSVSRRMVEAKAGVDLPDIRIWDVARSNLHLASNDIVEGRFSAAHEHIQVAAVLIVIGAQAINYYMKETSQAASQIATALGYVVTATEIAEKLLAIFAIGAKFIRIVRIGETAVVAETGGGAAATGAANRGSTTVLTGGSTSSGAANRGTSTVLTGSSRAPGAAANGNATVLTNGGRTQQTGGMVQRTLPPDPPNIIVGDKQFIKTKEVGLSYERVLQRGEQYVGNSSGSSRIPGAWTMNSEELAIEKRIQAYMKEFYEEMSKLHKKYPHRYDFGADMYSLRTRLAAKYQVLPTQNLP